MFALPRPVHAGWLLAGLILSFSAHSAPGDPAKGEKLANEACASCHNADGNSVVPSFPKIAGQHAAYLLREMKDYREGRRQNEIMQPLLTPLTEDDLANLAAYFSKQKQTDGVVNKPELLELGKRVYLKGNPTSGVPSCDGCHEENGEGSGKFPRVSGQHAEYTLEQVKQYATGKRSNGVKVMRTIAERLTEEELNAVVEYMSSLK
jgi:cytochrome c553